MKNVDTTVKHEVERMLRPTLMPQDVGFLYRMCLITIQFADRTDLKLEERNAIITYATTMGEVLAQKLQEWAPKKDSVGLKSKQSKDSTVIKKPPSP